MKIEELYQIITQNEYVKVPYTYIKIEYNEWNNKYYAETTYHIGGNIHGEYKNTIEKALESLYQNIIKENIKEK